MKTLTHPNSTCRLHRPIRAACTEANPLVRISEEEREINLESAEANTLRVSKKGRDTGADGSGSGKTIVTVISLIFFAFVFTQKCSSS